MSACFFVNNIAHEQAMLLSSVFLLYKFYKCSIMLQQLGVSNCLFHLNGKIYEHIFEPTYNFLKPNKLAQFWGIIHSLSGMLNTGTFFNF